MKNFIPLVLIIFLVAGCSLPIQIPGLSVPTLANLATLPAAVVEVIATSTPEPVQPVATELATTVALPKIDPEKTITLFLDGLKTGAKYALTSNLFSAAYSAKVKDDAGLEAILGPIGSLGEYKVGSPTISSDSLSSTLEGTIYMPQPVNTRFTLVIENGEWKIDEITILSDSGDYPTSPEGVVLAFLTAYQEAPDRMSSFLVPSRRAQQPPGGASAMLQISGNLGGMVVQSAAVSPEPPTAAINVTIRAGDKDYARRFLLTKDASGWGIDAIEVIPE